MLMSYIQLYFAGHHGVLVISNDDFYLRGKPYGMKTKLFVAAKYLNYTFGTFTQRS